MSEAVILWLAGVAIAVAFALIGVIWRQFRKEIDAALGVAKGAEAHSYRHRTEFAAFLAMDKERGEQWSLWRAGLEARIAERIRNDTEWRHDKYQPAMSAVQLSVYKLEEQVRQFEKWKNGKQE